MSAPLGQEFVEAVVEQDLCGHLIRGAPRRAGDSESLPLAPHVGVVAEVAIRPAVPPEDVGPNSLLLGLVASPSNRAPLLSCRHDIFSPQITTVSGTVWKWGTSREQCNTCKLNNLRGVAQLGSAPALGAGGPRFESGRPDLCNWLLALWLQETLLVYSREGSLCLTQCSVPHWADHHAEYPPNEGPH